MGSVLLTGCDGGLGLGLLKGLLEQPSPPQHLFAACLDPQGKVRSVLSGGQLQDGLGDTVPGGCCHPHLTLGLSISILRCECHGKIHIFVYI